VNAQRTTEAETQAERAVLTDGGSAGGGRPGAQVAGAGYLFWGVTIGVILLVELLGALGGWLEDHIGVDVPWTTISGMVGHLEDLWPATAVIVVALLAPAAFYALAPVDPPNELGSLRRGASGRWHRERDEDRRPTNLKWTLGYPPWLVFAICAVIGLAAVLLFDDDFHRAYVIYGSLFFFGIVVPSILVLARRKVGYPSLFVTVNHLRERRDLKAVLATVALSAGLAILVIHLAFYPWPDITKPPVKYAGLQANEAKSKANDRIKRVREGATPLFYSTQIRGVLDAHEAWLVYFTATGDVDTGCVVTVTDKAVDTTEQCNPTS
jgi:hypothetical protein